MKHFWLDAGSGSGYGSGFTAMAVTDPEPSHARQAEEQARDAECPEPAKLPVNRPDDPT